VDSSGGSDGGANGGDDEMARAIGITALIAGGFVGAVAIADAVAERRYTRALARRHAELLEEQQRRRAAQILEDFIDARVQEGIEAQFEEVRKRADAAEKGRDLRARSREQERDDWARVAEQKRDRRATDAEKKNAARERQRDERAAQRDREAAERERQRDIEAAEAERRRAQAAAAADQARGETASQSLAQFLRDLKRQHEEFDARHQAMLHEADEKLRAFNERWEAGRSAPPAPPGSVAARMKKLYDDDDP
jgi:colicin import membrane protein